MINTVFRSWLVCLWNCFAFVDYTLVPCIMSVQYTRGYSVYWGISLSTPRGYHEYTGEYHHECGGYHEHSGEFSVHWGDTMITLGDTMMSVGIS